ncbi:MAG: ACP S-malonyltransferase [Candidatus Dormibacteria bacterium]
MGAVGLVFPGQGAQVAQMGAELVAQQREPGLLELAAREGVDLQRLLVEAPTAELTPTERAQPCLYYTGVALGNLLLEAGVSPLAAAGHSLGEFCALAVSGAIQGEQGLKLVLERSRLMAQARPGTMAAVLGLDYSQLEPLCREAARDGECCVVANDNCPGQLVVSGTAKAMERLSVLARRAGARRVVPLPVGGAFHSPLMAEAASSFAALVDAARFQEPRFPVATGVDGALVGDAAGLRSALRRQLDSPVRWREAVEAMVAGGVQTFVECGPGATLAGLVRRTASGAGTLGLARPAELAGVVAQLDQRAALA